MIRRSSTHKELRKLKRIHLTLLFFGCLQVAIPNFGISQDYKLLPPKGIQIDEAVEESLQKRLREIQTRIQLLSKVSSDSKQWLPDVVIFTRAVDLAISLNGFYKEREVSDAQSLLKMAEDRLEAVAMGKRGIELIAYQAQQTGQTNLLVGGFRSRIDDSVQPYGLVVPSTFLVSPKVPTRMDVWLHGRGDTKTEVAFLTERLNKLGQYAPEQTVVLHPFGRHCNAFKFAGETDVSEAITHVNKLLPIDSNRISIRGFSMGGAGCWHLAVHQPAKWFAANPGAGFVDTLVYQGWTTATPYPLTETRKKLLNWYDVLPWVNNLRNLPTVAYSGEVDKQRQAADRVIETANALGFELDYVVGADMGHRIDPSSAKLIEEKLSDWSDLNGSTPRKSIHFTTYTLRYSQADWLEITGLEEHWSPGTVEAEITSGQSIRVKASGINRFKLDFRESGWPVNATNVTVTINGEKLVVQDWDRAPGMQVAFHREESWKQVEAVDSVLRKRPGLQGPIDDAFCDRFLFVIPGRPAAHGEVQRWIDRELEYAKHRWRTLMRGEIRTVKDSELTQEQIANHHLICFGDFSSNAYLGSVRGGIPINWDSQKITVGEDQYDPSQHALVMCYPNPRNPDKYIVVNSGMTFREFSNVSNSRQIPMLPDWAIIDVAAPEDGIFAGAVIADGFFDEQWQVQP